MLAANNALAKDNIVNTIKFRNLIFSNSFFASIIILSNIINRGGAVMLPILITVTLTDLSL